MNRLIQGDVGSGKTIVAFLCLLFPVESNAQVAFMAPTEVLAEQHFKSVLSLGKKLAEQFGGELKLIVKPSNFEESLPNEGNAFVINFPVK